MLIVAINSQIYKPTIDSNNGIYIESNPAFISAMKLRSDLSNILNDPLGNIKELVNLSRTDSELSNIPLKLEYTSLEQCKALIEFLPNDMTLADAGVVGIQNVELQNEQLPNGRDKSTKELIMWSSDMGGWLGEPGCQNTTLSALNPPTPPDPLLPDGQPCSSDDQCASEDCDSPNWLTCNNTCCDSLPNVRNCVNVWDSPAICTAPGIRRCEPKLCI